MLQIGAFPFLFKKDKLHIMLITNSSGKHWILPKGNIEHDLKHSDVAKLESYEEAGVKGNILDKKSYREYETADGDILRIYPLHIQKILDEWPEDYFRRRQLVTIDEALNRVDRIEHIKAIKYFSSPGKSPIFLTELS